MASSATPAPAAPSWKESWPPWRRRSSRCRESWRPPGSCCPTARPRSTGRSTWSWTPGGSSMRPPAELARERQRHATTRSELESTAQARAALDADLARHRDELADHAELLSLTKQELGTRVGEVTQLSGQLAQTEDARADLEEKLRRAPGLRGPPGGAAAGRPRRPHQPAERGAVPAGRVHRRAGPRARGGRARCAGQGEQLKQSEARFKEFTEAAGRRQTELSQKLASGHAGDAYPEDRARRPGGPALGAARPGAGRAGQGEDRARRRGRVVAGPDRGARGGAVQRAGGGARGGSRRC